MKTHCNVCGGDARIIRGNYRTKDFGPPVVLMRIRLIKCSKCGNVDPMIPNLDDLMRSVAHAIICQPVRLSGEEVRFLRKYIGKSGEEFAQLIHVDNTTLSKWENNHDPVGEQSDRLIRVVALALGEGLKDKLREVVEQRFPDIRGSRRLHGIEIDPSTCSFQYA